MILPVHFCKCWGVEGVTNATFSALAYGLGPFELIKALFNKIKRSRRVEERVMRRRRTKRRRRVVRSYSPQRVLHPRQCQMQSVVTSSRVISLRKCGPTMFRIQICRLKPGAGFDLSWRQTPYLRDSNQRLAAKRRTFSGFFRIRIFGTWISVGLILFSATCPLV